MKGEIEELAIRTSAAFMLVDMLARVLEARGILDREDLSEDILDMVHSRRVDLAKLGAQGAAWGPPLDVVERFAKNELRLDA